MKIFERYLYSNLIGVVLMGLLTSADVWAQSHHDVRWHGFVSQGVIHTSENNFFGNSTDTSFDFRDLGLGASWAPQSNLLLSAQAIYRDAGKTSPNGVNIDYAMINYSVINRPDFGFGLRVGRIKNPYGFYNETRDVAGTRPSVLLPKSLYPSAFRELFHSSDSVALHGYKEFNDWLVNVDVLKGRASIDEHTEAWLIPTSQSARIEDNALFVVRSILEYDGGRARFGATYGNFDARVDTMPMFPGDMDIHIRALSFEYNWEQFQFISEYSRYDTVFRNIFAPGLTKKRESKGYYFQLGWQLNEKLRLFSRYDVYYPDRNDKSGSGQLLLGRPKSDGFLKDSVVGAQYNFSKHWMLAGEAHFLRGTAALAEIENPVASQVKENWDLYTVQLSYKF